MNWKNIVAELMQIAELKQSEIALLCDCRQSSISELHTGHVKNPSSKLGLALLALHQSKVTRKRKAKAEA